MRLDLGASAIVFVVMGCVSRNTFRTTQTRVQIVVFWTIALLSEAGLHQLLPNRPALVGFVADASASTIGMIMIKWRLEGVPQPPWRRS